ncbi:MAG: hypothetical protein Q7U51_11995 [Methanoregula sp.]|nr:hypothetical protein [Methanoregula sp.]
MIPQHSFHSAKNRCTKLLVSRGYEPVQPVTDSHLSRIIPLHLVGMKGNYEALCVKVRLAPEAVSPENVESFCRFDICQLRSLLSMSPGDVYLRCEEWVASPNGSVHCFEVLPNEIREVAAYAR